jgi:tryptophanyl-tRNA synthetase
MKITSATMSAITLLAMATKSPFVTSFSLTSRRAAASAVVTSPTKLFMSTETEAPAEETAKPLKVKTRRILSGVQPTGSLHLGNYLGAIRQWVDFQNKECEPEIDEEKGLKIVSENFFMVVDLHAITMPHDPKDLEESTLASAALYLAAGIDPTKSKVFVQSHVSAHAELAWLLNCATPMNWLERMIQYKDKSRKAGTESVGVGLFTYPILMAADILLYQADRVPVGEDQRQHLELARDIVRRWTDLYNKGGPFKKRCKKAGIPSFPTFTEPEAMIVSEGGARVMSLSDGTNKMSKSDANDNSRINVLDPPKVIRDKIKKCKTDAFVGLEWDNPERPESTNLLTIYSAVQPEPKSKEEILAEVGEMSWGEFKPVLADAIIAHLEPIQTRYKEIREDETYLKDVLNQGADSANDIASKTLNAAKVSMGFVAR